MTIDSLRPAPWKTNGTRSVPQAFPYQGSKRQLAGQILSLFPHDHVPLLIEPFAGSAAISMAARRYGLAGEISISDVNAPLAELWRQIIEQPQELADLYKYHWEAQAEDPRSYFRWARDEFNREKTPVLLLYLLNRIVKAAVRYSQKTGDFNQSADHRRLGARPQLVAQRIGDATRLMAGAEVSSVSYESPLVNAPCDGLVYMDPPYQGTSDVPDHRYLSGLKRDPFIETLQRAVDNKVSFIVSYDVVTDDNKYGFKLPDELGLAHRHVAAGVSSQSTLSGRSELTVESLYVSPALVQRLGGSGYLDARLNLVAPDEVSLF